MILASFKTQRASSNWAVNTRTRLMLNPRNWFCLINSYKFTESSSKTRHKCLRWIKVSWSRRIWCLSSISYRSFKSSRTVTSIILWLKYAGLFLITFTATIALVFKFWHLTTCPKVPWPNTSKIRYLFKSAMKYSDSRSSSVR